MRKKIVKTAGVVAALWIAGSASAADTLFAYDGFDYAAGAELNGLSGGQGWADVWRSTVGKNTVVSDGLSYVDSAGHVLRVNGGSLASSPGSTAEMASRLSLTDFGQSDTTVWISFLQRNVHDTAPATAAGVTLGVRGQTNGLSMVGGLVKMAEGSIRSGIKLLGASGVETFRGSIGLDETLMHVLRLDFQPIGNDTMSLWRDPELGGDSGVPDVTASFSDLSSLLSGLSLVTSLGGPVGNTFGYDELRIGNSWTAVTPTTAVPEPASWLMLLAGGGAALFARRHHRQA